MQSFTDAKYPSKMIQWLVKEQKRLSHIIPSLLREEHFPVSFPILCNHMLYILYFSSFLPSFHSFFLSVCPSFYQVWQMEVPRLGVKLQLQLKSDPWTGNSICHGIAKKEKKILIRRKNFSLCMVTYVNWIYCGDHIAIYTNIDSLCFTPKSNTMLYVN